MFDLSVILCTHNPRETFLRRTLQALAEQSLARARWELLLIDNSSKISICDSYDISWHPHARHINVKQLGKTHALRRGISEARAEILVIADDDNLLAPDYLETALRLLTQQAMLGVIGGRITGEYESVPSEWAQTFLPYLAIVNRGDQVLQTLLPGMTVCVPPGAGMVIRVQIAKHYLEKIADDPRRQSLDPVGDQLSRAGDTDMAFCAFDTGWALGYDPSLRLTHLIPAARLMPSYLQKLVEESSFCTELLLLMRGLISVRSPCSRWRCFALRIRSFLAGRHLLDGERARWRCELRGIARAHHTFRNQQNGWDARPRP